MTEQDAVDARRIVGVRFEEKRVLVELRDGRRLAAPLSWVGRAAALAERERAEWVVVADGLGVNWPAAGHTSDSGALEVWVLEQDALYERALAAAAAAAWDADALRPADRELLALWRLDADVYNGGFLQFLGNWGAAEVGHALGALRGIGASTAHDLISSAWDLVRPLAESEDVNSIDDLIRALGDEGRARLDEIDEAYWEDPDGMPKRVSLHYGPAQSAPD
jgi:hypothetical protein